MKRRINRTSVIIIRTYGLEAYLRKSDNIDTPEPRQARQQFIIYMGMVMVGLGQNLTKIDIIVAFVKPKAAKRPEAASVASTRAKRAAFKRSVFVPNWSPAGGPYVYSPLSEQLLKCIEGVKQA